jgi:hypothetical protein
VLSALAASRSYKEDNLDNQVSSILQAVRKKDNWKRFGREQPFREDLSAEAEESLLLEAVTRERLAKTQQARKDLTNVVVILNCGAIIACNY